MRASRLVRVLSLAMVVGAIVAAAGARGQDPLDEVIADSPAAQKLKELTSPEAKKKAQEKSKRPPFDIFRTQISPSDVVPHAKASHWSNLRVELQANLADYSGVLRTGPVRLMDMPNAVVYQRDARLVAEQRASPAMSIFVPRLPRDREELLLELTRPDAIVPDISTAAFLQRLRPHQTLIPVLADDASKYANWNSMQAVIPTTADRDPMSIDQQRYMRLLIPQDAVVPLPLPQSLLTWTTISHVIWEAFDPGQVNLAQQQAMVDWLHWGGQLIVVGGAAPTLGLLQGSFLEPYLPATPSGTSKSLTQEDLAGLREAYPDPVWPQVELESTRYREFTEEDEAVAAANRPGNRTLYVGGLTLREGATGLPFPGQDELAIGAEWRVGRGRVLVLAFQPTDSALGGWKGLDTLVRTVVLRRPMDGAVRGPGSVLSSRGTCWLRIGARDLGAPEVPVEPDDPIEGTSDLIPPRKDVAAWLDEATLPRISRELLKEASGISVPDRAFVLRIVLMYGLVLIPLNWLACRYVLRRRELAWVVAPVLALGVAALVQQAAAYDAGISFASDEIDFIEIQGDYPRGHLSRFVSVYATGRIPLRVEFPPQTVGLALPMSLGSDQYRRGEDVARSVWTSSPATAMENLTVQPRTVAMYRSEQMIELDGGITLETTDDGQRRVVNRSGLSLRDVLVLRGEDGHVFRLGSLAAGETRGLADLTAEEPDLAARVRPEQAEAGTAGEWLDPERLLRAMRNKPFGGIEDVGAWKLMGWADEAAPGQTLEPVPDRQRGLRLVFAHLDYPAPPSPERFPYRLEPEEDPEAARGGSAGGSESGRVTHMPRRTNQTHRRRGCKGRS